MLHATPIGNTISILKFGILAGNSKGGLTTVWCCVLSKRAWAKRHATIRHQCKKGVAIFEIDVPRRWLLKGKKRGLWHTRGRDIPPGRIKIAEFHHT